MQYDRRSFFQTALSALGILSLGRLLKTDSVWAAGTAAPPANPIKARKGGTVHTAIATDESLAGLPKANGVTASNFWHQGDKIATVQNFCDASISGNSACSPKRQAGQFCGNCTFLQNRVNYDGNVVGKCQLIPDQPPKTLVAGNNHCASYVNNAAYKYGIKA